MTKAELLERLTVPWLAENGGGFSHGDGPMLFDEDEAHKLADKLLLDYIGDEDIRAAFSELPKWYA